MLDEIKRYVKGAEFIFLIKIMCVFQLFDSYCAAHGSSAVECRTLNRESPGSSAVECRTLNRESPGSSAVKCLTLNRESPGSSAVECGLSIERARVRIRFTAFSKHGNFFVHNALVHSAVKSVPAYTVV